MVTVISATLPPATDTVFPDWVPPETEVTATVAPFRMYPCSVTVVSPWLVLVSLTPSVMTNAETS